MKCHKYASESTPLKQPGVANIPDLPGAPTLNPEMRTAPSPTLLRPAVAHNLPLAEAGTMDKDPMAVQEA